MVQLYLNFHAHSFTFTPFNSRKCCRVNFQDSCKLGLSYSILDSVISYRIFINNRYIA